MSKLDYSIWAKGRKVKTYYGLTKDATTNEEEAAALRRGISDISNLVYKRVKRLEEFEQETGITSPALQKFRETGYSKDYTKRGDLDKLREKYKAMTSFISNESSKVKGTKEGVKKIEEALREIGWEPEEGTMTGDEYTKFKALEKVFYSEQYKTAYYNASGGYLTQEELRQVANAEIARLLNAGDLETVLEMAKDRLDEINETGDLPDVILNNYLGEV